MMLMGLYDAYGPLWCLWVLLPPPWSLWILSNLRCPMILCILITLGTSSYRRLSLLFVPVCSGAKTALMSPSLGRDGAQWLSSSLWALLQWVLISCFTALVDNLLWSRGVFIFIWDGLHISSFSQINYCSPCCCFSQFYRNLTLNSFTLERMLLASASRHGLKSITLKFILNTLVYQSNFLDIPACCQFFHSYLQCIRCSKRVFHNPICFQRPF